MDLENVLSQKTATVWHVWILGNVSVVFVKQNIVAAWAFITSRDKLRKQHKKSQE